MKLKACFGKLGIASTLAVGLGLAFAQGSLFAAEVTRTVAAAAGGCRVTLAWNFSEPAESDLVIEERLGEGWSLDGSSVPLDQVDAFWFAGDTARFAVKPSELAQAGSISFLVVADSGTADSDTEGDWRAYLGGKKCKDVIAGKTLLSLDAATYIITPTAKQGAGEDLAIISFKVVDSSVRELGYEAAGGAGTLVVEGCGGLGADWKESKRVKIGAGSGKVILTAEEVGECRFMRLKFFKEDK